MFILRFRIDRAAIQASNWFYITFSRLLPWLLNARVLRRLCPWLALGRSAAPAGCFRVADTPVSNIANERFQPPKNGLFFPLYVPVTDNFPCKFFGAVSRVSNERKFSELRDHDDGLPRPCKRMLEKLNECIYFGDCRSIVGYLLGPSRG